MLAAERQRKILQQIERDGAGKVADLSRSYGVSDMTIRRDLKALSGAGRIQLTQGGAVRRAEEHTSEARYLAKLAVRAPQKQRLARYAAETFVEDGDIVILEGGTTVTSMAPFLARRDLTVVTNGLFTLNELQRLLPRARVLCCGGILREGSLTFVGPHAENFFHEFHANKLFLSGTGLTLAAGLTDMNMFETSVKKAMLRSAQRVVVLADAAKLGLTSLTTVLAAAAIDALVTEVGAAPDLLQALRSLGVDVHAAPS